MENREATSTKTMMPTPPKIKLMHEGVENAIHGFSIMVGREIRIQKFEVRKAVLEDVRNMYGGAEALIVGVCIKAWGCVEVHMLVAFRPQTAFDLVDLLLGQAPGSTKELPELEQSVLGEVGNITGSLFLSKLADATGKEFRPSPPAVMMDMAGAVLEVALVPALAQSKDTYLIEAGFATDDEKVSGTLLVIPTPALPDIK